MSAEIDLSTGLPELPEGYRWTVFESLFSSPPSLMLELERSFDAPIRRRFRKTTVEKRWTREIRPIYVADSAEAILEGARKILEEWDREKLRESLIGSYPPKTLAVSS